MQYSTVHAASADLVAKESYSFSLFKPLHSMYVRRNLYTIFIHSFIHSGQTDKQKASSQSKRAFHFKRRL